MRLGYDGSNKFGGHIFRLDGVLGAKPLGERVADDTARWRVVARHDVVAKARGGLSPLYNQD